MINKSSWDSYIDEERAWPLKLRTDNYNTEKKKTPNNAILNIPSHPHRLQ